MPIKKILSKFTLTNVKIQMEKTLLKSVHRIKRYTHNTKKIAVHERSVMGLDRYS